MASKKIPAIPNQKNQMRVAPQAVQTSEVREKIIEQLFNKKIQDVLMATPFPEYPSKNWYNGAYEAMEYTSPLGLGICATDFIELKRKLKVCAELSMLDFSIASNNAESKSQFQMQMEGDEYNEFLLELESWSKKWQETFAPMQESVSKEIQDGLNVKQAVPGQMSGEPAEA